jgi:hypothetical protein
MEESDVIATASKAPDIQTPQQASSADAFDKFVDALVIDFPQIDESLIRVIAADYDTQTLAGKKSVYESLGQLAADIVDDCEEPIPRELINDTVFETPSPPESVQPDWQRLNLLPDEEDAITTLHQMLPAKAPEVLLKTLRECDGDLDLAANLLLREHADSETHTSESSDNSPRWRHGSKSIFGPDISESLTPQYKPVQLDDDESDWSSTPTRSFAIVAAKDVYSTSADEFAARAQREAAKATGYARTGRSNKLFNAAAAVALSNARKANEAARDARSAQADIAVAEMAKRNPGQIDLHGMQAVDARRIAVERTRMWWEKLGEKKVFIQKGEGWKLGADHGLVIIVGKGTHSAGQRGVLGPAVMKVLEEDGWKFENEIALAGRIVVKSRKLRK